MKLGVLALWVALMGGKVLPPDSILPPGEKRAAAFYEQIGNALFSWQAFQPAVENYQKSLEKDSERASARIALARALANMGLGIPAVQQVQVVLKDDPQNPLANRVYGSLLLAGGDPVQAERTLRRVVARSRDDAIAHKFLGMSLFVQKKVGPAIEELTTAVKLNALDPDAQKFLAQALLQNKQLPQGMAALAHYLELRPLDVEAAMMLAELYVRAGMPEEAARIGVKLAGTMPDNPKLLMGVAGTLVKLGRPQQAAPFFYRASVLAKEPELLLPALNFLAQYHLHQRQYQQAASEVRRMIAAKPELLPPRMMLVQLLGTAGDWAGAAAATRALVALQPDNLGFRMQLLQLYLRARAPAAAVQAVEQVSRRWPSNLGLQVDLARALLAAGRPDKAVGLIEGLARRAPGAKAPLGMLVGLLRQLGRGDEALAVVARLHQLDPNDPLPTHELAAAAFEQRDWARVVSLLEPLFARRQVSPQLFWPLAWSLEQLQRYEEAARVYELTAYAVNAPSLLTNVARQYEKLGNLAAALGVYQRILKANPKHLPALLALARDQGNSGDLKSAAASFRKVLSAQPTNALALRGYALAMRQLGQPDEAIAAFKRLAAADPKNAYAYAAVGDIEAEQRGADAAIAAWLDGLAKQPAAPVLHRRLGDAYADRREWDQAIAHYTAAADRDVADFTTRMSLATLDAQAGLFAAARNQYRDLLDRGPELGYLYRQWLATFNAEGQGGLGLESGLQLLAARPTSNVLAAAVLEQATATGRLALLGDRLTDLLHTRPDAVALRDAYGQTLAGAGRTEAAQRWFAEQARRQPKYDRWPRRLGELAEPTDPAAARAAYEQASRLQPNDPGALNGLARTQLAVGQPARAAETARRLMAVDPQDEAGYLNLIAAYEAQGRLKDVRDGLYDLVKSGQEGRAAYARNPALLAAYGYACERSGMKDWAAHAYESALAINSHWLSAQMGLSRIVPPRRVPVP